MFKFGFSKDAVDGEDEQVSQKPENGSASKPKVWAKAEEILMDAHRELDDLIDNVDQPINLIEINEDLQIECASDKLIAKIIEYTKGTCDVLNKTEADNTDLIPSIYEGGLKIWQCTYDLLDYLSGNGLMVYAGKKVLDLGCGAGLLGMLAFLQGAEVWFQDYNADVIKFITIPNVLLNETDECDGSNCKFFAGDWQLFCDLVQDRFKDENRRFDYIFSSETIYNCDNYTKLINIFKNLMKKSGALYLAAKTCYFGVGGGTREFEDRVQSEGCFNIESVWKTTQGVQREILKLTFKSS